MAFSSLKVVVGPLPPAAGPNESHVERPTLTTVKRALFPHQVGNKEEQNLQALKAVTAVPGRDTMLCLTAASLSGVTLFLTEPVEARNVKPELRRKIMEKLKMLREKAGVSKPKTEDEEKTPPLQPLAKEKELPLPMLLLPPFSNPQKDPAGSLVEANLPR